MIFPTASFAVNQTSIQTNTRDYLFPAGWFAERCATL